MDLQKLFDDMVAGCWAAESFYRQVQPNYVALVGNISAKNLSDADLLALWNDQDTVMGGKIQADCFPTIDRPMTTKSSSFPFLKKVANDPSEANWQSLTAAVGDEYGKHFYARTNRFTSVFNNDLFNIYSPGLMNRFLELLVDENFLSRYSFKKSDSWFKKSQLVMKTILSNIQIPSSITGVDRDYRLKVYAWQFVETVLVK